MKEVVNVSLQGVSFTMEKEAQQLLENYLNELGRHYGEQEAEVVNDIEERIAELLVEKGCRGNVVQVPHIEEIIGILGMPNEFDSQESGKKSVKKRIYRDTQNGVVAGICSGLAVYLNIDVVWLRVIMVVLLLFLNITLIAVYCILWFIIPAARTIGQRCEMRGESQGVDQIHRKFAQGAGDVGGEMWQAGTKATCTIVSAGWRIFTIVAGAAFIFLGFVGIASLGVGMLGFDMLMGVSPLDVLDFMELNIGSNLWLKVSGVFVLLLPCVALLYGGMQLCFRFKSPKWRPGLVMFLIWIVSLLVFMFSAVKAFNPYYNVNESRKEKLQFVTASDTLYIKCPRPVGMEKAKMSIDARGRSLGLLYLNNERRNNVSVALYPNVELGKSEGGAYIETTFATFSKPSLFDEYQEKIDMGSVVQVKDSLMTVYPSVYSKNEKFAGKVQHIKLCVPENTVVVLQDPIDFIFGKSVPYSSGIRD